VVLRERGSGIVLRAADLVPHAHEHERAAATLLLRDVLDRGDAGERVAEAQRRMKRELAARPHAARQGDGRQEAAALGVAVGTESGLAVQRQEVQPVP
jgi:hypothetical protein